MYVHKYVMSGAPNNTKAFPLDQGLGIGGSRAKSYPWRGNNWPAKNTFFQC